MKLSGHMTCSYRDISMKVTPQSIWIHCRLWRTVCTTSKSKGKPVYTLTSHIISIFMRSSRKISNTLTRFGSQRPRNINKRNARSVFESENAWTLMGLITKHSFAARLSHVELFTRIFLLLLGSHRGMCSSPSISIPNLGQVCQTIQPWACLIADRQTDRRTWLVREFLSLFIYELIFDILRGRNGTKN